MGETVTTFLCGEHGVSRGDRCRHEATDKCKSPFPEAEAILKDQPK